VKLFALFLANCVCGRGKSIAIEVERPAGSRAARVTPFGLGLVITAPDRRDKHHINQEPSPSLARSSGQQRPVLFVHSAIGVVARPVPTDPACSISSTATKRAWALSRSSASLVQECAKSTKVLVISALAEASASCIQLRACSRHSLGSPGIGTMLASD
jgi:hypothetical protein